MGRAWRAGLRRWTELGSSSPHRQLASGRTLRARRPDRQGALVERQHDRVMEPFQWADRGERTCLHRDIRRHALLLRDSAVTEIGMRTQRAAFVVLTFVVVGAIAFAQPGRGGSQWLTALGDAQRTSWVRSDDKISLTTMSA